MFRRLIRARRRVPVQSAGHESSDRSASDSEPTPDVYHACIGSDGPVPLFIEDLTRLKKPRIFSSDVFRRRARSLVSHVTQEERNAAHAWSRLQQLYTVFQAVQDQANSRDGDTDDALASLLANGDNNDTILHDFHELTAALPEGFTPQMFTELGNALFSEMVSTQQQQQHIGDSSSFSRSSFESLGDQLFAQSSATSSAVVSVSVSA